SYQLFNGISMSGGPLAGSGSPLDFGSKTAAGIYTVLATNLITGCTATMNGSAFINVNPLPLTYAVTGGGTYCAGDAPPSVDLAGSEEGVVYQLYRGTTAVGA